ncbi:MAG: hypothetical protein Q4D81_00545 [Eubacteriales bacterium]|nr:hypothetical protein [Eubacteriales bacterium]
MANITPYTEQISTARYGNQVRSSIVAALEAMNRDINDDTASAQAYAGNAAVSAQAAANTADGLSDVLSSLSALESTVEAAEGLRGTAEASRVSAENARVVAEAARENSETGYVAQARNYAQQAASYATSDYAIAAKSWAVGDTAGSREGENTNNAKYWAQQAQSTAQSTGQEWQSTLGTLAESWINGGTGTRQGENTNNAEYWCGQAEAWAVGTESGTPSPTNNAKYWAGQAEEAADAVGEEWSGRLETIAQSWVEGGTSTRSGEDTNNAKYWAQQAEAWADQAGQVVTEGGVASFNGRTGIVTADSGDYTAAQIARGTGSVETALASIESGLSDLDSDKASKSGDANITVDKSEWTSTGASQIKIIGSQGTNQISLIANNHNNNDSGLYDPGNSRWILEYDKSQDWVKIRGVNVTESIPKMYTTNNLQNLRYISASHSYSSGETMVDLLKDWIADGKIELDQTFVLRGSMGSKYWACGLFYKSSNKTYGSCICGNYTKIWKVFCNNDTWTQTEL